MVGVLRMVDDCAMKIIACKHSCNREMDMRLLEEKKSPKFWLIYGVCWRCDVVVVSAIFQRFPRENVDYFLNYTLVAVEGSK